jgi:hypothetical protein
VGEGVRRRLRFVECPACGYDLDGLRDGLCPECGRDLRCTWKEIDGTRSDLPSRRRADAFFRYGCMPLAVAGILAVLGFSVWQMA